MTPTGNNVEIQLDWFYRAGLPWVRTLPRLLVTDIRVGSDYIARVAIDPGMPTRISRAARDHIASIGTEFHETWLEDKDSDRCVLHGAKCGGDDICDIDAQITDALQLFGVDAILGFEFFSQYSEVCLEPAALLLTLHDPVTS